MYMLAVSLLGLIVLRTPYLRHLYLSFGVDGEVAVDSTETLEHHHEHSLFMTHSR